MQQENSQEYSLLDFFEIPRPHFTAQNKPAIIKAEHKGLKKPKPSKPQVQVVLLSLFDELDK